MKEESAEKPEDTEIEALEMYVHKQGCLGMGKRLTWHLEHARQRDFEPH